MLFDMFDLPKSRLSSPFITFTFGGDKHSRFYYALKWPAINVPAAQTEPLGRVVLRAVFSVPGQCLRTQQHSYSYQSMRPQRHWPRPPVPTLRLHWTWPVEVGSYRMVEHRKTDSCARRGLHCVTSGAGVASPAHVYAAAEAGLTTNRPWLGGVA